MNTWSKPREVADPEALKEVVGVCEQEQREWSYRNGYREE